MAKTTKARGVGAATQGFGAVSKRSEETYFSPEPVDENLEKQKDAGELPSPTFPRIPQPTSW